MTVEEFLAEFGRVKASAILRTDDQEKASLAMDAAIRGGFTIVEFTLTVPGAYELIADFSKREGIIVGAGTVLEVQQARRAVDSGARFLVSPVVDPVVIQAASEMGVASMPGTHTPTEMWQAHRAGASLCKLFPCPNGGSEYVSSVMGPMPFLKIVPTNGVDHHNASSWIKAGAYAVGFVASLFDATWIANGEWETIEQRARQSLAALGK